MIIVDGIYLDINTPVDVHYQVCLNNIKKDYKWKCETPIHFEGKYLPSHIIEFLVERCKFDEWFVFPAYDPKRQYGRSYYDVLLFMKDSRLMMELKLSI